MRNIVVRGARVHNLKNISVDIPRDQLTVITGVSGSGKSTLAFDTIYAEGQRRYVESLSAYARQFLQLMEKPDVDAIEGLSPAISIEQKTISHNPRSTVGTVTEIYDYLRLLYARAGQAYCSKCGREIASQTVQQMTDRIVALPEGSRILLLAPVVRGRKGEYQRELRQFQADGFIRVRVDGELRELGETITLDRNKKHTIEVVVDRLIVKAGMSTSRLADSLETALRLADGIVVVEVSGGEPMIFSEKHSCPECGVSYPEVAPRLFSFNNPFGACPECTGLGVKQFFDPERVIPDPKKSLAEGAIAPWQTRAAPYYQQLLAGVAAHYHFSLETPFAELAEAVQRVILYGSGTQKVRFVCDGQEHERAFSGVIPQLERRYAESDSEWARENLEALMSVVPCPVCHGKRLRPEALQFRVGGKNICEVTSLSILEAREFFARLKLSTQQERIVRRVLREIQERLAFLVQVGLDYLSLDRTAATLSGGEGQRIRLASQIGSSLTGVLYVLDEPSIGLHQRDNRRLLESLMRLRDLGNTVVVVEHDEETIRMADHVIDMGPGAGELGGTVVAQGTAEEICQVPESLTGQYLAGVRAIPVPEQRREAQNFLTIRGASENNLRSLDATIPLGVMTCVTGVSGSGKSTLIIDTLNRALEQHFGLGREKPGRYAALEGVEHLDKVINIDQSPIGRTPRSNPATYTGVFTDIRMLFAQLGEAKIRAYTPGRFSFNVKGGRCEACQGDGMIRVEMHFLPDVYVPCEMCKGRRYNRETLEVMHKGKNIAEVLDMTVAQALDFLGAVPKIRHKLETLCDVGLDYIRLGQSATTLSGGEAQRVKLAKELTRRATGRTLYILDEPTTGLHFADIHRLLIVLQKLVDQGNTVVIIEHNLDIIKSADYILDLGPEGGSRGGTIIASGTPEEVAATPGSFTGEFLRPYLAKRT